MSCHGRPTARESLAAVFVSLLLSMSPVSSEAIADWWSDGFESYPAGRFPTEGGWVLAYAGQGAEYQYVDITHAASGMRSLHLTGSSCWAAEAYRPLAIPDSSRVNFEATILINEIVSCGCTQAIAHLALTNPNLGTWGTYYGMVYFGCDGYISAGTRTYPLLLVQLMPYEPQTWYHVQVEANVASRSFDVYVNGNLVGSALPMWDEGIPSAIEVTAGHGSIPVAWFDDMSASIEGSPVPNGACCGPDGTCTLTLEGDCADEWLGEGIPCGPNPCPQPTGACCDLDGTCALAAEMDCPAPSEWMGAGTVCDPNPCPPPMGACCLGSGECLIVTSDACTQAQGNYLGNGVGCDPNPCETPIKTTTWGRLKNQFR